MINISDNDRKSTVLFCLGILISIVKVKIETTIFPKFELQFKNTPFIIFGTFQDFR